MRCLCVATCGRRKIWDVDPNAPRFVEARSAYIGPLSKLTIKYAQKFHPNDYVILSAKYGFLLPHEKIENYDAYCNRNPLIKISELKRQIHEKRTYSGLLLSEYDKVIVLGGRCYCNWVKKVFGEDKVECPITGLAIGKMMKKISDAIKSGVPLVSCP
ncbi:hypothetical protein P8X24_05045 [Pyrococcus kukulkanii]|uniref:DUF6884 domain-containing protein n=1 Tax=Pyrococcus kukulkanii TaxID=1609559 RepID=UPI003569DFFF